MTEDRMPGARADAWLAAGSLGACGGLAALAVSGLTDAPPVLAAAAAAGTGLMVHALGRVTDSLPALRYGVGDRDDGGAHRS